MVSPLVLTAAPLDALALPVAPIWLVARLRAVSAAIAAALAAALWVCAVFTLTVPATALVPWVPLTEPPAVLT